MKVKKGEKMTLSLGFTIETVMSLVQIQAVDICMYLFTTRFNNVGFKISP